MNDKKNNNENESYEIRNTKLMDKRAKWIRTRTTSTSGSLLRWTYSSSFKKIQTATTTISFVLFLWTETCSLIFPSHSGAWYLHVNCYSIWIPFHCIVFTIFISMLKQIYSNNSNYGSSSIIKATAIECKA